MEYQDLQARTYRLLRDPDQIKYDLETVKDYLNEAEREFCARTHYALTKSTSITTVAGTQEYALPTGFSGELGVFHNGAPLRKVPIEKTIEETPTSGEPSYYYVRQNYLGLYSTPATTGATITVLYNAVGGSMVVATDAPIIPERWQPALALYAAYWCALEGDDTRMDRFSKGWDAVCAEAAREVARRYLANLYMKPGELHTPRPSPVDHDLNLMESDLWP